MNQKITEETQKDIVSKYLNEEKTLENLATEYHVPSFIIKMWIKKYKDILGAQVESYAKTEIEKKENIIESNVDLEVIKDAKESTEDQGFISLGKRIDLVIQYLTGEKTIKELADEYNDSIYNIMISIAVYSDSAYEKMKKLKYKKRDFETSVLGADHFESQFKTVIADMARKGMYMTDIERWFGVDAKYTRQWKAELVDGLDDSIDLDLVMAYFLFRREYFRLKDENMDYKNKIELPFYMVQ